MRSESVAGLVADPIEKAAASSTLIHASQQIRDILALVARVATGDAKVLITGESGTGKDLIAREIHGRSPRASRSFIAVNCAGLTETLLESELFGHVKGSFTGAYRDKPGKLQLAHRGTLFLDEVGEMSLRMQALLLRFLENGEIQAVGADHIKSTVDVRVVAATNRNLGDMVANGQFREDLLYRLRVIHIHVPPLRERKEDVRVLVQHLATKNAARAVEFSEEALRTLERYRWPGNVRELQNVVEQALWMSNGSAVEVDHLPVSVQTAAELVLPVKERRKQVADELYGALVNGGYNFWEHVHPLFLQRDVTRHDMRELVRRGLATTRGNYRSLLRLFGLPAADYKRFLNFLAAHDCNVDFRAFRAGTAPTGPMRSPRLLPPLVGHTAVFVDEISPDSSDKTY
ncbi:MAG: sigma 54-interacting transcriptional regulator [Vicinamibacteria bacterium]|nr:sigma 54-interacting transcriptional regulator [Vicinamibacteria bacterium]